MGAQTVQKLAYLFLEEDEQGQYTHAYQFVHDGSQQTHLEYMGHEEPQHHKHHDADEHIERPAFLHQPVDVVEQQRHQQDVDYVFYAKIKKHVI